MLLDKSVDMAAFGEVANVLKNENESVINDLHVWKIAATHQAAILSVETNNPLQPDAYRRILKRQFPGLSHISIEVNQVS